MVDFVAAISNILNLVQAGGGFIIPLFLASAVVGTILMEQSWYGFLSRRKLRRIILEPQNWDQHSGMDMISRMTRSLAINRQAPESVQKRDMELIYAHFERRINWLNTLAAIAPMLGLLGTVAGMIRIFSVISAEKVQNPLAQLSGGLSEALFATGGGLIVAIVAALGYHYLNARLETTGQEMAQWYDRHNKKLTTPR